MKKKSKMLVLLLAILSMSTVTIYAIFWAYNPTPLADYVCHFTFDTSVYSQCRVFTQTGMAIIQENSQGLIMQDLLLNGAPVGSYALWTANNNGTILVTFPNSTLVICNILHAPHGPCGIGVM